MKPTNSYTNLYKSWQQQTLREVLSIRKNVLETETY